VSTPRQLWLSVNEAWLTGDQDPSKAHDIFGINERFQMMPSAIIPGNLSLGDAHDKLAWLKPGSVALGYGTFWIFWETDAVLGPCEDDNESGKAALDRAYAEGTIVDMYGGCYQLLKNGEWELLGAS